MSTFSCQCQNYRGNLVVTEKEFYFTSTLFRIELEWSNVKRIRLETQQVKGVPTSVLVVVLQHNEPIRLQATSNTSQRKRGSASRKYFFYGFQDLLGAEEQIKHYLEQHRAAERTREKDGRDDVDKVSSSATKQPEKATEKDDISSSDTDVKEDSLNLSRVAVPRRPESEPPRTVAPLSFSGRRATNSTVSRPKIPAKLLTTGTVTAAEESHRRWVALLLRVYRYIVVVLVVVVAVVLARNFSRSVAVSDGRYAAQMAEKLLHDIDSLAGLTAELESYDNQESLWRYNNGRKRLAELSRSYTQQLEETSVELMERYVAIQAKLTTLRGHRAAHVARAEQSGATAPPPPPSMSSEFSTPKTASSTSSVRLAAKTSPTEPATTAASAAAKAAVSSASATATRNAAEEAACAKNKSCKKVLSSSSSSSSSNIKTKGKLKPTSLAQLRADIQRWVRRGASAWSFLSRLTSTVPGGHSAPQTAPAAAASAGTKPGTQGESWVVYSEGISGAFHMTEWVSAAEDDFRHKCLALTKDLLDTLELTERVFATFTNVFLADRYRQLESGEERASYWLQPPQALRAITNGRKYFAKRAVSGDAMARMALLRRFVASLVHNEPLMPSQAHRRAFALRVADALVRYRQQEVSHLRTRNRGDADNTTMLWRTLNDLIVLPATEPLRGNPAIPDTAAFLRNSVEELRFWHTHDAAWREHVLTFFSPEEQAEIRSSFDELGGDALAGAGEVEEEEQPLGDPNTQPGLVHWVNLPLFRGLLCFESVPVLHDPIEVSAEDAGSAEGEEDEDDDEDVSGNSDSADGDASDVGEEVEDDGDARTKANASGAVATTASKKLPAPTPSAKAATTPARAAASPKTVNETDAEEAEVGAPTRSAKAAAPHGAAAGGGVAASAQVGDLDLWKEVKLRWMADLEVFRLAFDPQLRQRTAKAARSFRLDTEDRSLVADSAEVRRRLFGLLALVNENYVRYLTPNILQRLGSFLRRLFPPYSSSHSGKDVYVAALQSWGTQDPAVQLAVAQVTGLGPGTTRDVSGSLLYLILQPPPLLQTSMLSTRKTLAAGSVLVLFAVVLTVLHFMQ